VSVEIAWFAFVGEGQVWLTAGKPELLPIEQNYPKKD
jgi:hypothetical protein